MKRCLSCGHAFGSVEWLCPLCSWHPASVDGYHAFAPELARENDGFAAEYFTQLSALEQNHFWFRARNALLSWALGRYFQHARSFLEIGCGTGCVLTALRAAHPQLQVTGSEIFTSGLSFASARLGGVELFQMDARAIPFETQFDVIGAFDVLEHIDDDEAVLRQMYRAVKPGGGILITVPQHQFLWSAIDEFSCHKRRYSRSELVSKAAAAGFRVVHTTSFVSALLPLLCMTRGSKRSAEASDFDPRAELKIGPLANGILLRIMNLERQLLQREVSLPAGGSLLLVANRSMEGAQ